MALKPFKYQIENYQRKCIELNNFRNEKYFF